MVNASSFFVSAVVAAVAASSTVAAQDPHRDDMAIASHSHLNDATALINKNTVAHSNNLAVSKSNVLRQQNDDMVLEADTLPAGLIVLDQKEPISSTAKTTPEQMSDDYYRTRFYYPGFGGSGGYYGWRYPLWYWRMYSYRLHRQCPFGRIYGYYFYC
ncbi:hypothetical protein P43SY_005167 [Pythium insidiosum]|uniref:AlNc14C4G614 n=1 Tax=Pythium insidiosum TaxID=114742 RepID=A0AAD5M3N7_PYTIN|nr:hypothetical protein P43SY_005167 [Pythium insidiosum]